MAVSTTDTYSGPYTANGITTDFPFTFKAADEDEVGVLLRVDGTDSIVSTGYSVDLTDSGGTVSFDAAPEDGEIYVYSEPAFTQEIAFANGQPFLPTVINTANDRSAIRDLYLKGEIDRSLKFPLGQAPADHGSRFPYIDADGNLTWIEGSGVNDGLRTDLALEGGAALVGTPEGPLPEALTARPTSTQLAAPEGAAGIGTADGDSVETALANRPTSTQLASSAGAGLAGFSQDAAYDPGTLGKKLQRIVYVTDAPYNAVGDDETDNASAFEAALAALDAKGGGILHVPAGTFIVSREIKLPSNIILRGAGMLLTTVKAADNMTIADNVLTNSLNDRLERTTYNEQIHISDMTVDANWQARAPTSAGNTQGQASCIKYSTVRNCSIKRLRAVNGILHCLDIMASTYFDDGNINHTAVGPSLDCVIEDCIAENSSRDDGITTHNSGRIIINRCFSFFDRATYVVPGFSQHGIEIDEGSWEVSVLDCHTKGWQAGFQIKGHSTTMPAIDVRLERCFAEQCSTGFHIEHLDPTTIPVGQSQYARNVTLRDCRAKTVAATDTNPATSPISIGGYQNVIVDGFVSEDIGASFIKLSDGATATLRNIRFMDASTLTGLDVGLIHGYADVGAGPIFIENVSSAVAQPIPIVRFSSISTVKSISNIKSTGSDNTVACVWISRNVDDQVRDIRQTGFLADVWSNSDNMAFSNYVEIGRGYQLSMRGTGSPEGAITAPGAAVYYRYSGSLSGHWVKATPSGNAGWKQVTQAV